MGKSSITKFFKDIAASRSTLAVCIVLAVVAIVFVIVTSLSIHSSDVTIYNRYTAFGQTHFYKSYWQYQWLFVLFGVAAALFHIVLVAKLQRIDRRQTALFVGWLGVLLLMITLVYTLAVMSLGRAV